MTISVLGYQWRMRAIVRNQQAIAAHARARLIRHPLRVWTCVLISVCACVHPCVPPIPWCCARQWQRREARLHTLQMRGVRMLGLLYIMSLWTRYGMLSA